MPNCPLATLSVFKLLVPNYPDAKLSFFQRHPHHHEMGSPAGQVRGTELKSLKSEKKGRKGSNLMELLSKSFVIIFIIIITALLYHTISDNINEEKRGDYFFLEMLMLHISQNNFNKRREFLKQSTHILYIFLFCSLF